MSGLTLLIFTGVILVAGIIVVFGLVSILSKGQEVQERMHIYADVPEIQTSQATSPTGLWLNRTRVRLNILLSGFASEELSLQLARANWMISVTEFFLIRIGLTFVAFLSGWAATRFVVSGVALAVVIYLIPGVILSRSVGKRQLQFGKQLLDVLVLMNGAVRAGFSMLQSLEFVVKEMTPPASDEFRRVLREVSLGLTISQALTNLAQRMEDRQ